MDFAPIARAILDSIHWALLGAVLLVVLSWLRRRRLGARGEAAVYRRLRRCCAAVADDLILPDGRGGLTQLDHLALTPASLLIVESKNYNGLIFGQARDRTWTQ